MSSSAGTGGHDAYYDDAAAYVLGALTAEEHELFTVHLEGCSECREEVARLQVVADALPLTSPQVNAPPRLKQQLMSAVTREAAGTAEVAGTSAAAGTSPARHDRGPATRAPRTRRRSPRRWAIGVAGSLAAAAVVLAAIALATSGGNGSARVVRAQVLAPGASASLRIDDGRAELLVNGMPQVPPRRTYQVWVQRGGSPQPTDALFSVSSTGGATVAVPGSVTGARAVLVTAEPLGGSRAPTSAPVIVARLG